ncbi:MAG: DHHW family protein [Oscillospiraceae bacterium]|nr:DHHW family protein [Oscillospiraceae bacterium]
MRGILYFLLFIFISAALFSASCAGNCEPETESLSFTDSSKIPELDNENITPEISTGEQTSPPVLTDKTFLSADRYCIAGKGEEGAIIRVEGGIEPAFAKVIDGQFILEVFLENQSSEDIDLNLYAKTENKDKSDALIITVKKSAKRENRPVYIGKENHLHYNETIPDFLGNSLFSDDELDKIKTRAENLQQILTDEGLKTKVIIFVSPSHNTIYPETMPDFLTEQKISDNSRLRQLTETFKNSSVMFINPYDRLMKEKENYFIYNRTDTHWNELGAYFGYCELFDYIGKFFPNAKPRPLSDFNVYNSTVKGGDLIPMLEFDQSEYIENAVVVRIKNPAVPELYRGDTDEISYQETFYHKLHEYESGDNSKPSILMYRDSFSISMMSPIAETSGRIIFYHMWNYDININYIKEINPDFLIIQRVERSLNDLYDVFIKFK